MHSSFPFAFSRWFFAGLVMVTPALAHAGASETKSVACGSAPASWSAPDGALVLSRSRGIIDSVLTAVGEYYTHSMISHGPGGLVSHSTMYTPGTTGWPTLCSTPLKSSDLLDGYPGASQVDQGAIYSFLYLGDGELERIIYQQSTSDGEYDDRGAEVSSFLWYEIPYAGVPSRQDSTQSFYRLAHHQTQRFFNYVLYQYRNEQELYRGEPAWNDGSVCSTFIAYAHHMAGNGDVLPKTYDHQQVVAAGNALYASVQDSCSTSTGWFLDMAAAVACFEGICDDAARQTRNCMTSGVCNSDSDDYWRRVANDPGAVAVSTSPDRLGGWSGHPHTGEGVSVWADDDGADLQWNSGGDVYGCWF